MTYGTKIYKNGKRVGYLHFATGKKIYLNEIERNEYDEKIRYYQSVAIYMRQK
jgi:hypothetical protein